MDKAKKELEEYHRQREQENKAEKMKERELIKKIKE